MSVSASASTTAGVSPAGISRPPLSSRQTRRHLQHSESPYRQGSCRPARPDHPRRKQARSAHPSEELRCEKVCPGSAANSIMPRGMQSAPSIVPDLAISPLSRTSTNTALPLACSSLASSKDNRATTALASAMKSLAVFICVSPDLIVGRSNQDQGITTMQKARDSRQRHKVRSRPRNRQPLFPAGKRSP